MGVFRLCNESQKPLTGPADLRETPAQTAHSGPNPAMIPRGRASTPLSPAPVGGPEQLPKVVQR